MTDKKVSTLSYVIANLGGEMVYILDQRLNAQGIRAAKAQKVLEDITYHMFSPDEKIKKKVLSNSKMMYSSASTREIFRKLAHSSIMKLTENSMEKLYDLMNMGFKYQFLMCQHPIEMMHVTLNHLDQVSGIINRQIESTITPIVENEKKILIENAENLNLYSYEQLRIELLSFFQDKKVKVSLFLTNEIQNQNGSFKIPIKTEVDLFYDRSPGDVIYFDSVGNEVNTSSNSNHPYANAIESQRDLFNLRQSSVSEFGVNLYSKSHEIKPTSQVPEPSRTQKYEAKEDVHKQSNEELNLLAKMLGGVSSKDDTAAPVLMVGNLFSPEDEIISDSQNDGEEKKHRTNLTFSQQSNQNSHLNDLVSDFDIVSPQETADDESNDLLDLMDGLE